MTNEQIFPDDCVRVCRCCACPETKRARDECYMNTGSSEADEKCKELVAAHVKCMRGYGFEI